MKRIQFVRGQRNSKLLMEWKMTPIFDATEQGVWTNLDDIQQISSTDLLNWTLQFFVTEIEKSLLSHD